MKKLLFVLIPIFIFAVYAFGAESVTISTDQFGGIQAFKWSWVSDPDGDVSGDYSHYITGTILGVRFVPAVSPSVPTDQYDVRINDENGVDVLQGVGANLSQSATNENYFTPVTSENQLVTIFRAHLTPVIDNAGGTKEGVIWLYLK